MDRYQMTPALLLAAALLLASPGLSAATKNGFELDGALVPVRQIHSGGPPKDGIPALDTPAVLAPGEASYLRDSDRVLGVSIGGQARAYPIRILNHHEIVNDVVGGEKVVITYCPLCGSGTAFDSAMAGHILDFGVSGLLYNNDVLMYDRQTQSLWSQIMMTAVTGDMKGSKLNAIPVSHTTWRDWKKRHPESEVLSTKTGHRRNYDINPYAGYENQEGLFFPVSTESRKYPRKMSVLGIEIAGRFKAYPFAELKKGPSRFIDRVGGQQIEVLYDDINGTASAKSEGGETLPTMIAYWFAWYAFHPDTEVHTAN